ncbi:MAG: hypothetical protein OEW60_05430 [Thiovulaceae bacterium]|nr:hypothetical protein [Sulfurimonadaceae bacterium]
MTPFDLSQRWLDTFKLALIHEDEKQLLSLIQELPTFSLNEEMQQAQALIQNAIELFEGKKPELKEEMLKIRKTKKYLNSTL